MNAVIDESIRRWVSAGIIDSVTENRIRSFEASQTRHTGARWQVILALAFGGILLTAGLALFVAAHWATLSPRWRFVITLAMVVVFHLVAVTVQRQFAWLATMLHGVGTVAAGTGIFLTGQIFNIREDWSAGVLLCLLCAMAGWLLLRDQVQQLWSLLLLPSWIMSEWAFRTGSYIWSDVYEFRLLAAFSIVLMTIFLTSRRRLVSSVVVIAGTLGLYVAILRLAFSGIRDWNATISLPAGWRVGAWLIIVLCAGVGVTIRRATLIPVVATLAMVIALPYCQRTVHYSNWTSGEPNVLAYAVVGAFSALLAWYGVRENSRSMINIGLLYFAATVIWFYFSDVMGKLDRSLSLMLLGVLLLGGGWLLEKMRRRLIAGVGGATGTGPEVGQGARA